MMMMCPGLISTPNSLGRKRGRGGEGIAGKKGERGWEGRAVDTCI